MAGAGRFGQSVQSGQYVHEGDVYTFTVHGFIKAQIQGAVWCNATSQAPRSKQYVSVTPSELN